MDAHYNQVCPYRCTGMLLHMEERLSFFYKTDVNQDRMHNE